MKKALLVTTVLLLAAAIGFAAGQPQTAARQETINLRLGAVNPANHPFLLGAQRMAELVEERSNGRITITLYPSSQLGGVSEMVQQTQVGALDLTMVKPGTLADMGYERFNVFELPYVFRDEDHLNTIMFSEIGEELLNGVQAAGVRLVGLSYYSDGARSMFFRNKEVRRLSDMRGQRVRVQPIQIFVDLMDAFGASATPIAYAELFSALQTGVVDAAENPLTGYYQNNFHEVAPIFVFNEHTMAPTVVIMSELTWNRLSAADRDLIKQAAVESGEYVLEVVAQQRAEIVESLRSQGVQLIELEDKDAWLRAARPVVLKYGANYTDLIDRIQGVR